MNIIRHTIPGLLGLTIILSLLCTSCTQHEYTSEFDLPLLKESRRLFISGDYKAYLSLQKQHLETAGQEGYTGGKALCYIQLARINSLTAQYKAASSFLQKADSMLRISESSLHRILLYDAGAELNKYLKLYDLGLYYNDKTLALLKNAPDSECKDYISKFVNYRRGDLLFRQAKMDSALFFLHKGASMQPQDIDDNCILAEYHSSNGNLDSAGFYLHETATLINRQNSDTNTANDYNHFHFYFIQGNYYTQLHRYKEAETAYLKAMAIGQKWARGIGVHMSYVYLVLTNFYKVTGDPQQSDDYQAKYFIEKERLSAYSKEAVAPTMAKFMADINQDEKNEQKKSYLAIGGLIIGMALCITLFFIYRFNDQRQRKKNLNRTVAGLQQKIDDQGYEELVALAITNDPLFLNRFQQIYPTFTTGIKQIHADLEPSEFVFCAFIKLNFTTKEIATYTGVLPRSVEQRKSRLRKKLHIPSDVDLYDYFQKL